MAGGIGILVLFVAVLSFLGVGSKALFQNESSLHAGRAGLARIQDMALLLVVIYLGFSMICTLGLRGMGLSWLNAVCHAMATLSNIGPAFGAVGPTENFSDLRGVTKSFLAVLMILGRLELFAVLALFLPSLWRRY